MSRADHELAFLLRYENVAWYENHQVRILDRRIYPLRTEFVVCSRHEQVAEAIAEMVTQSGGPATAAAMGMALAAYECREDSRARQEAHLALAAHTLSHARPTTAAKMSRITERARRTALAALDAGAPADQAVFALAVAELEEKYARYEKIGALLAEHFVQNGVVMTQCFAETVIGMMLRACREAGKSVRFLCPETRPFLQGARLTASCILDMGFDVTVITDNMPAWAMHEQKVDLFTSAADIITMDGHIVNKVGTLQIALAAHHWGIPYYVTGSPDPAHPTAESIALELRDGAQTTQFMGLSTVRDGVKGWYPAFDITPPELCTGVVTERGIFAPASLGAYPLAGAAKAR
ncbi:MAG: s-methyl-5-thioribose-1-phosphate isomerase [Oscillospiraceae bacterium]